MEENTSVNTSEPAEQTTEVSEENVTTEEETVAPETTNEETPQEPELDRNAIYADARRKAEAEAKHKYSAIDAQYAEKFKGYKNPITGAEIKSAKDYFEAIAAQEELATKKTLADNGIDPSIIERAVNNSPAIRTANQVIAEQRARDVQNYLEKQIEEVSKIDPDIKSAKDIENSERYPEVLNYVQNNRLSIVDAYKLVYADKLVSQKTAAVKQQAINNARSQSHLTATEGGQSKGDSLVEIPQSQLEQWKQFFPNKSPKELKEAYNRSLHK